MIEQGLQQTGLEVAGLDAIAFSRGQVLLVVFELMLLLLRL